MARVLSLRLVSSQRGWSTQLVLSACSHTPQSVSGLLPSVRVLLCGRSASKFNSLGSLLDCANSLVRQTSVFYLACVSLGCISSL